MLTFGLADSGNVPVSSIEIPEEGRVVHLGGYGFVRVFKTVYNNGDVEYYATDDTKMNEGKCKELSPRMGHRGLS